MKLGNLNAEVGSGELTSVPPVAAPVPAQSAEFWGLPRANETLQGLRRGSLYSLWKTDEIQMISVRLRGKGRGRRLVVAETLMSYLRRLRHEQCAAGDKPKGGTE